MFQGDEDHVCNNIGPVQSSSSRHLSSSNIPSNSFDPSPDNLWIPFYFLGPWRALNSTREPHATWQRAELDWLKCFNTHRTNRTVNINACLMKLALTRKPINQPLHYLSKKPKLGYEVAEIIHGVGNLVYLSQSFWLVELKFIPEEKWLVSSQISQPLTKIARSIIGGQEMMRIRRLAQSDTISNIVFIMVDHVLQEITGTQVD